jgi:hypothetical protein
MTAEEARSIGARARMIRRRPRVELGRSGGLAGIFPPYLSILETGRRGFNRRSLLEDLSNALACSVADLAASSARATRSPPWRLISCCRYRFVRLHNSGLTGWTTSTRQLRERLHGVAASPRGSRRSGCERHGWAGFPDRAARGAAYKLDLTLRAMRLRHRPLR